MDVIDLTPNVTVGNIAFDTSAVAAYTIGSGAWQPGAHAEQQRRDHGQQHHQRQPTLQREARARHRCRGRSYTITNNDLSNTLTFAGGIAGGTTGTAGAKTLNVSTAPLSAGGISLDWSHHQWRCQQSRTRLYRGFRQRANEHGQYGKHLQRRHIGGQRRASQRERGAGAGLGTGDVTVDSGGQVYLNSGGTYTNNFSISGLAGLATHSPPLGAIRMGGGTIIINGNVTLNANSSIGVDSGRSGIITGNITGAFNLDKTSTAAGTGSPLTLTGTNDYATTTVTRV